MQIIIDFTDGKVSMTTSEPLSLPDFLDITATLTHQFMSMALNSNPSPDFKEYIHHLYNVTASNVLDQFAPDIQLRPDITEEIIMDLEAKRFTQELKQTNKKLKPTWHRTTKQ